MMDALMQHDKYAEWPLAGVAPIRQVLTEKRAYHAKVLSDIDALLALMETHPEMDELLNLLRRVGA